MNSAEIVDQLIESNKSYKIIIRLLTNVSWAFNGDVSKELNIKLFEEFLKYIKDKDSKDINVDLEDRI